MRQVTLKALIEAVRAEGEPPLRVPASEQPQQLEALRVELLGDSPHAQISKWSNQPVLVVHVELPGLDGHYSYHYSTNLTVRFEGEELQVTGHYGTDTGAAPLSGSAQLRRLMAAVRERMLEERRQEQKRDKIRKLKERSIEAQLDEIAARMRFAYVLRPMQTKVKLIVRLDDQSGLFVDIPHNRIQESLVGLEKLIEDVRQLYGSGVRFKVNSIAHIRSFRDPAKAR